MSPTKTKVKQKKIRFKEFERNRMRSIFFPISYTVGNSYELDNLKAFLEVLIGEEVELEEEEELASGRFRATFDVE